MTTSVPQVVPLEEWKRLFVRWLEAARELTNRTGDFRHMEIALYEVRRFYEEQVKVAANKHGDFKYLEDFRRALELAESNIEKKKQKFAFPRPE